MSLQVLISTMNQNDYGILKKMNINSDAVVINQCDTDSEDVFDYNGNKITWVNSSRRGLSRSRNLAISKAAADICVIADDDMVYVDNYKYIITEQFEQYPIMDILTFQVEGIERKFKSYKSRMKRIGFTGLMKLSSVEIAFKRKNLEEKNIKFNEDFGSGSIFSMGEENILLYDCFKNKLKMVYIPVKIANLHFGESSWFKGYNEKFFKDRGAGYTAMGRFISHFLILQYGIRKINLYKNNLPLHKAISYMYKGRKIYLKEYNK